MFDELLDYDLMSKLLSMEDRRRGRGEMQMLIVYAVMDTRGTFVSNGVNITDVGIEAVANMLQFLLVPPSFLTHHTLAHVLVLRTRVPSTPSKGTPTLSSKTQKLQLVRQESSSI